MANVDAKYRSNDSETPPLEQGKPPHDPLHNPPRSAARG